MESGNGSVSSKGFLIQVPDSSDVFEKSVLAPLRSVNLYEESKQCFRYNSAFLVKNSALEEKYNNFRANRRQAGYSEEELKESYGFLLFDDFEKAIALGEKGVPTGNSTCTILGDPKKGIYISMYSDCLDVNRWYNGRTGFIAIIKLIKGKVTKVLENYTENFTEPTVGFDCHVSKESHSVSSKSSAFIAFERSQYYMYELLNDGSNKPAQSPSAACPIAIVSCSYTDTKATLVTPQEEKSEVRKIGSPYLSWRGELQIGGHSYHVGLRSTAGAFIPAELPPVVKVDKVISMVDLRHLLPKAVFETCFTGEALLDGFYCSLCALVFSEIKEKSSIDLLLEIKRKDVALIILLNDGGFLILLHSSHFLACDDFVTDVGEILQGVFVFSHSRVAVRDTKVAQRHPPIATEILQCLPALTYAEGEVEKSAIDPSDELCDVVTQHMQSYAVLINPGLESIPSREDSVSPRQYDVLDDLQHLDSSPGWDSAAWQSMRSYLSKPASFQLPLSKASRALAVEQEEQEDDLEDITFICQPSPEIDSPLSKLLENQSPDKMEAINLDASLDCGVSSSKAHAGISSAQENIGLAVQAGHAAKDRGQYMVLTEQSETNDMEAKKLPPTSNDLPTELIVSITSADQSVGVDTLSVGRNISTTRPNDFKFSDLQSCNDESDKSGNVVQGCKLSKPHERILQSSPLKGQTLISAACVETTSSQTCRTPEVDDMRKHKDKKLKDLSDNSHLKSRSNTDWRKGFQRKCKFGNMSLKSNETRLAATDSAPAEEESSDSEWHSLESSILMELGAYPLRKKTERWDLKPVISESGRILVPFGSVDIANQIISMKKQKQARKREPCLEKVVVGVSSKADDTEKMEHEGSGALETSADEKDIINSVDGKDHHTDPDQNIFEQLNDGGIAVPSNNDSYGPLVKKDDTDLPPSLALQEKQIDTISTVKLTPNSKSLLSKLQSVLLKGKRKGHFLSKKELTENTVEDTEPFLKKGRVESVTETSKGNHLTTLAAGAGVKDVSSMMPVDLFAYALGLTPKETHGRLQRTEHQESLQGDDSAEAQRQNFLDKLPQSGHRPPSSFSRRGRIKTLKKHQGISEECIKKKWWLHFQTPACNPIEKLKCNNSIEKSLQEKLNNARSSADGLNLLADLALSASSDRVSPQSHPTLERKPETSLKKGDITKSITKTDQDSFLHTLLRQHTATATQPPECCSPSHPAGDRELVDLLLQEHAYSLPPSSSLLLGLPGTPLPACPISGSTRLLPHQQAVYGDRIKALHPPVGQEDQRELKRTEEHMKKYKMLRQNFRNSRTFDGKGGSLQVTRQWHENYNFDQDSKFTSDMKNKAINRALHGPWDFSIPDTNEEVRLIVHMWISLFYSRSTARFFHIDPNFTYPCSEEYNFLEIPREVASSTAETELKASSNAHTSEPLPPKALDLSKKHNLDSGQDAVVLDLSLTNFTAETVPADPHRSKKESSVSNEHEGASEVSNVPKSPGELHKANTHQSHRKFGQSSKHSLNRERNDVKSIHQMATGPIQSAVFVQHRDVSTMSFQSDRIRPQKTKNAKIDTRSGQMFRECNREDNGKSGNAEDQLVEKHQVDLSKLVADIKKYRKAGDRKHEMGLKDDKSSEMKQDQSQEVIVEPSVKEIFTVEGSASEQLDIICSGLENQTPHTRKEPERNSLDQAEINGDVDSCPRHEAEAIKSDKHSRENCLDKKDKCISAVEDNRDLGDKPVTANSDDIVLAKGKDTKESTGCVKMDEQCRAENITVACRDLLINTACADGISLTDESTATEIVPQTSSELLPIDEDFSSENSPEKDTCLTDDAVEIKKVLPMCAEITSSSAAISIPQTKYDAAMETHRNLKSDFPFDVNGEEREHQKTKSADGQKESKNSSQVLIPFLEMDLLGDDASQPEDSLPQHTILNNKDIVQDREEMPLVAKTTDTEAVLPNEMHGTFQSKKAGSSSLKLPLHAESEAHQPVEWDCDHRCPTPTIDEQPYENISSSSDGSLSPFTDGKIDKNITQTYSSTPNEIPEDQQLCKTSAVSGDCSSHVGIHLDVEARTIQVPQSVKNLLSTSNHNDKPYKIKKADMKDSLDQTSDPRSYKSHSLAALEWEHSGENISNSCKTVLSTECLQANKPNADQQVHQTKSQSHISHESHSDSQRPVMTVKPSKSNKSQVNGFSEDPFMKNSSKNKQMSAAVVTPPSMVLEKTMKELPTVKSPEVEERFKVDELSSIDSWLTNYRSNLDKAEFDILEPSCEYRRRNGSNFNRSSSSSMQILEPAKSVSLHFDGNQGFSRCSTVEDVEKGTEEMTQMDHAEHSHTSASFVTRKDNGIMEDVLLLRPQTSLACTISNTSRKRPIAFLEQLSNRCRQVDLTQASLEQECLIFSEKMKQLLKKSKKGRLRQQEPLDTLRSSCIGPLTVHFSSLEEQDDSLDLLDTSLLGQKIKVDMSNRKTVNSTKEIHSSHSEESSQRASDLVEYSVVSDVTRECTRLFEAAMDDICAVKKPPSRSKRSQMDESFPKAGPSNHFDFCNQMKREIDETFRSQLNSVVKKSCKTKYRFFILWTSDDVFFDETKAQLEAEGHTAVNPSEFFAGERLSSLLIILRNEDIAEHICQIPRLLELKRSSNVLFAGIDEPDDVINLTHQELFTRGGFIVIDKAALESLSLGNMRKISQILHELNKNVKWKWVLHYRDSRRLKENARLSAEAKEKKHFLQWGQEAGILEVLPYHECDLMSRDQPDYLACLLHLQIQNISSRYSVFITDTKTDGAYERNGILTMTLNSFLTKASSEIFSLI